LPALVLVLPSGCGTLGGGASKPVGEIHLFGVPTALTIAGSSVAGGVGVRIYASEVGGTRGIPISQGRLEVLMFDQSAAGLDPQTQKPLKVWSFEAPDLAAFQSATMMGTGYQMELTWDRERPKGRVFTVVVRYLGPGKTEIYSTPAVIAIATH
jgi:hypothetical protein